MEFLTQLAFLLCGLVLWSLLTPGGTLAAGRWVGIGLLAAAAAGAMLAAQRFGILRLVEGLMRQVAARLPTLPAAPLDGLHDAATALYRRRAVLLGAGGLHLSAWLLGTLESWVVLNALGFVVPLPVALVVESLGMAGRSAGFAIPGALVVQETGFVLAGLAVGLPESAGLALSLVKRAREVTTGLLGLALWKRGERAVRA